MEIKLNDLLKFSEQDLKVAKIKFNQSSPDENPLDLYQKNPEIVNTQWLFWRESRHYFAVGQIAICFLKLTWDTWLLTTIKRITKNLDVRNGITYEGEDLQDLSLVVFFGSVDSLRKHISCLCIGSRQSFQTLCFILLHLLQTPPVSIRSFF